MALINFTATELFEFLKINSWIPENLVLGEAKEKQLVIEYDAVFFRVKLPIEFINYDNNVIELKINVDPIKAAFINNVLKNFRHDAIIVDNLNIKVYVSKLLANYKIRGIKINDIFVKDGEIRIGILNN
jgi:hypothetical protein